MINSVVPRACAGPPLFCRHIYRENCKQIENVLGGVKIEKDFGCYFGNGIQRKFIGRVFVWQFGHHNLGCIYKHRLAEYFGFFVNPEKAEDRTGLFRLFGG
jgi:hypothetical protein